MRIALLSGLLPFLLLAACGDDGSVMDSGPVDAGPDALDAAPDGDAGVDSAVDSGPGNVPCAPCRRDDDCPGEALCLVLDGGERGCGLPCTDASECAGFAWDMECAEEVPGLSLQCRPTAGTCVTVELGAACGSDAACAGRFDRCVDADGLGGRCTSACTVDADCPVGAHRCRDVDGAGRVCILDGLPAAERCAALVRAGTAESCTSDGDCASGACLALPGGDGVCAVPAPCVAGPEIAPGLCAPSAPADGPMGALLSDCACYGAEVPGSLLDEAIGALDRDRCDMHWPSSVMNLIVPEITHDPFRLSFTDRVLGDWSSAVPFAEQVTADLDAPDLGAVIARASAWIDLSEPDVTPVTASDLGDALVQLVEATGATPDPTSIHAQADAMAPELAARLAPIVAAVREAVVARDAAVSRFDGDLDRYYAGASGLFIAGPAALDLRRSEEKGALLGDVDVAAMTAAAARLAATIEAADLSSAPADGGELTLNTPIGRIAVRGETDHVYENDSDWSETLLLVDLGGDDTYRSSAGATASANNGVSVVIDVRGADTYGYDEVPVPADDGPAGHARLPSDGAGRLATPPLSLSNVSRQGVGRLGIGMLFDLGTDPDSYRSLRFSQGYGALGVGVLFDEGGDDDYHAEAAAQGAGSFRRRPPRRRRRQQSLHRLSHGAGLRFRARARGARRPPG